MENIRKDIPELLEELNQLWKAVEQARKQYYAAYPVTSLVAGENLTKANEAFTTCWKLLESIGRTPLANDDGTRGFH